MHKALGLAARATESLVWSQQDGTVINGTSHQEEYLSLEPLVRWKSPLLKVVLCPPHMGPVVYIHM